MSLGTPVETGSPVSRQQPVWHMFIERDVPGTFLLPLLLYRASSALGDKPPDRDTSDRKDDLYEAALLTRCYTQHAIRPYIDSEINYVRHFI